MYEAVSCACSDVICGRVQQYLSTHDGAKRNSFRVKATVAKIIQAISRGNQVKNIDCYFIWINALKWTIYDLDRWSRLISLDSNCLEFMTFHLD